MKLVYALSAVAAFSSNVIASKPSTTDANRVLKAATKRVDLYRRSVRITRRFETELVYVDNENVWSDRPTFASQVKVSSQKPVLNLEEHEHHLQSVECGKDAIKLHFVDASSARDARAACHHNGAGLIITSHEGCNDEGERSVYRVNDVSFAKDGEALEVSAAKTTWQDAFDHVNVTFGHTTEDHIYRRHADFAKIREKRQNRVSIPGNTPDNVNTVNFNLSSEVVDKTFATTDFLDIIGAVAPLPELPIAVPIELGCKRCATTGQLSLSQGAFNIDLSQIDLIPDIFQGGDDGKEISSVITGGFVELQAIGVGARLELFARPSANGMFEVALFQVPIAGFVIPGIGQAGAIFEPRVRFEFQVTGGIEVTAGLDLKVPDNSRLRVELTNLGKSELVGFQDTSLTPLPVNLNITDVDIVLGLAFKPAIPVGFEFFNQIKAEVTATLELPRLDAKLSTNIAGECGNGTRNGTAPPPPPRLAPPAPAPPALGPTAPAHSAPAHTAPAHSAPAPSAPALYAPAPYAPAPPALEPYKNYTKRQLPAKPIALGPIALVSANVSVSCDIGLDVSIPILPPPFNAVKVSQNIFKAQLELVKECSSPEAAFKNSRAMRIPPPPPPAITAEAMNGTMANGTVSSMAMGRLNATTTHGGFSALPYPAMTYTEAAPFAKATPPANATAPYVAGTLAKHSPAPYVAYTAPPYATTNHTSTTVMAQQTIASSAAHILSSSSAKHLVSSKAVSNHTATAASTSSKMPPPPPPMLNHTSTAVLAASSSSDCATPSTTHVTITETVTSTLTRQLTQNVTATTTAKITEATTLPSAFSFSLFSTVTIEEEKSSSSSAAAVVSSSSKPVFTPPPPPPASSSMAMSSSSSSSSSKEVVAPPPLFTLSLGSSMMASSSSSAVAEVTSSTAKVESSTAVTVESSSMMMSSAAASSTPAASSSSSPAASSTPEATSSTLPAVTSAPPTTSAVQPAPIMSRPPESLPELEATVTMGAGFLVPTNGTALPARANATGITEFTGAGSMNRGSAGQVMVWVVSMVVGVVGIWML